MKILDLQKPTGELFYYDRNLRITLESHIPRFLSNTSLFHIKEVDNYTLNQYFADFYAYLDSVYVEKKYHWFTLKINRMRDPREFCFKNKYVVIPNTDEIDVIKNIVYSST